MAQESFLDLFLIIGDVIFKSEVSSAHSGHQLVSTLKLDIRFLGTKQIKLALNMNYWDGKIVCIYDLLHSIFEFIIFLVFNQKWDWLGAEELMGLFC